MKKIPFIFLFLQFFWACNNGGTPASENDIDAARNFIQAALNGDYKKARTFILDDSTNNQYLDAIQNNYETRMAGEDKRGYRESTMRILAVKPLNDSATVVNYSNTYKKENDSVKVVRINGQWLVDLKYSFPHR